jgi:hypothetical protein
VAPIPTTLDQEIAVGIAFLNSIAKESEIARRRNAIPEAHPPVANQLQLGPKLSLVPIFHEISVATDFQLERLFHFIRATSVKRESSSCFSWSLGSFERTFSKSKNPRC